MSEAPFVRPAGYVECVACGANQAFKHVVCAYCREGAGDYNCDPDSVFEPGFDPGLLAYWAAAGAMDVAA